MTDRRASGILLHPTSLPGTHGIGDIGKPALEFVDFLSTSGQKLWQILPLHPAGYGNSPYQCFSVHAGNHLLINIEDLFVQGLLDSSDICDTTAFAENRVDYDLVRARKLPLLRKAFKAFNHGAGLEEKRSFESFCEEKQRWLDIYSVFMALKVKNGGLPWYEWENGLKHRDADTLSAWCEANKEEIQYHKYVQYQFFKQWDILKQYCNQRSIRIIGDIPIFVALDSASTWAYPELFYLDRHSLPTVVAGVPPDYFSRTGQRWGNPLYRWDVMAEKGYSWWIERFRATYAMVDIIRLDHFRGFEKFWQIPMESPTAEQGTWVEGPGSDLFVAAEKELGKLPIIAEDLGVITPEVDRLREELGYLGMRVLQFAFGDDPKADDYKPHNFVRECVVYTGTHDNDTVVGWFNNYDEHRATQEKDEWLRERRNALAYTGTDGRTIHLDFIRMALASIADWAVIPLQDILGLGSEARMNYPGTTEGNWRWRFSRRMLTDRLSATLRELTEIYGR